MKTLVILSTFLTLLLPFATANGPSYFLEILASKQGEIYNKTKNGDPANSTPVLGFNVSAIGSAGGVAGTGAGAGKVTLEPLNVKKDIDSGTPLLMQALLTTELLETVTLTVEEPASGGQPAFTLVYKLANAYLTTIEHIGTETTLVEKLSFAYAKIEVDFTSTAGSTSASS